MQGIASIRLLRPFVLSLRGDSRLFTMVERLRRGCAVAMTLCTIMSVTEGS